MPYRFLFPAIVVFCAIGTYNVGNSAADVYVLAAFGALGYVFLKLDCEPAPFLLGFVLGPMLEDHFRRAMLVSRGDPMIFSRTTDQRRAARHLRPSRWLPCSRPAWPACGGPRSTAEGGRLIRRDGHAVFDGRAQSQQQLGLPDLRRLEVRELDVAVPANRLG